MARIDQRVAVVSNVVDRLVDDYRREGTNDSAMDVFRFNLRIFHGYSQASTEDEALKGACEALAVAVKKLAEATAAQDQ